MIFFLLSLCPLFSSPSYVDSVVHSVLVDGRQHNIQSHVDLQNIYQNVQNKIQNSRSTFQICFVDSPPPSDDEAVNHWSNCGRWCNTNNEEDGWDGLGFSTRNSPSALGRKKSKKIIPDVLLEKEDKDCPNMDKWMTVRVEKKWKAHPPTPPQNASVIGYQKLPLPLNNKSEGAQLCHPRIEDKLADAIHNKKGGDLIHLVNTTRPDLPVLQERYRETKTILQNDQLRLEANPSDMVLRDQVQDFAAKLVILQTFIHAYFDIANAMALVHWVGFDIELGKATFLGPLDSLGPTFSPKTCRMAISSCVVGHEPRSAVS